MSKPVKLSRLNGKPALVPYDAANRKDNDRAYNQRRSANQSKYVEFYKTSDWLHTRQQVLTRDYHLGKPGYFYTQNGGLINYETNCQD